MHYAGALTAPSLVLYDAPPLLATDAAVRRTYFALHRYAGAAAACSGPRHGCRSTPRVPGAQRGGFDVLSRPKTWSQRLQ